MFFRQIFEEGLAQASYIVGCPEKETALVVDPRRDIDVYLQIARDNDLKISAVTETHIHADFLSGSRELAAATGATLYLSGCGGDEWAYKAPASGTMRLMRDGDTIDVGRVMVRVRHVPGHTPEHVMFLISDDVSSPAPMIALTGDFVFVGDVGRPDLLEAAVGVAGSADAGARAMYKSLRDVLSSVPNFVQIWPGHGAGSACGKALGAVPASTVGYEKLTAWWAPYLERLDENGFVRELLDGQPDAPTYFARMKRLNRDGAPLVGHMAEVARLDAAGVRRKLDAGAQLVDTRARSDFKSGHVAGAFALPDESTFVTRTAWVLDPDGDIVLIAHAERVEPLRHSLHRVGLDRVVGFVDAADEATIEGSAPVALESVDATIARRRWENGDALVLDVRNGGEFRHGHIPGALHIPASRLVAKLDALPRDKQLLVHCAGGGRSVVAASALVAHGFTDVVDVAGGFDAWEEAGYPVERKAPKEAVSF